jgi:Holliday junction resolvase RusA-like endonuclease
MSTTIRFVIPGTPVAKARPRAFRAGNGVRMHTPERTVRYENLVAIEASHAMGADKPLLGPVAAFFDVALPVPQSWSKKKRAAALAGDVRPTSKPDVSNIAKSVEDGMNKIVYQDDSQITELVIRKRYAEKPALTVRITTLEGGADE